MTDLNLTINSGAVSGEKETLLRRVTASFLPDGKIEFEGTICDRIQIESDVLDTNWRTVSATYENQSSMVELAAKTWNPSQETLEALAALANEIPTDPVSAVELVFRSFTGISSAATLTLLNPSPPEIISD